MEKLDLGVSFGLGYKLKSGFNFGARYYLGLTRFNDPSLLGFDESKFGNSVFQAHVGYFFKQ